MDSQEAYSPRFDWTFNFGHVLTASTIIAAAVGGVWYQSSVMAGIEHRLGNSEKQLNMYGPVIDALRKSDNTQDERIQNMMELYRISRADSTDNIRAIKSELQDYHKTNQANRESIAKISANIEMLIRGK